MALVNNNHNFIFFHMYKCGGNSLRKIFTEQAKGGQELLGVHCHAIDLKKHYMARQKEDKFNDMFKFTIVRNPFALILSTYHYVRKFKNHYMHEDAIKMEFKDFPAYYLKVLEDHKTSRPHGANRVSTLYDWITDDDGNVIIDFIGKLENINEDTKYILDKLGLENEAVPFVNVNKMNDKPYRDVYDKETRIFVEKHFAKDLEYFNYEW